MQVFTLIIYFLSPLKKQNRFPPKLDAGKLFVIISKITVNFLLLTLNIVPSQSNSLLEITLKGIEIKTYLPTIY